MGEETGNGIEAEVEVETGLETGVVIEGPGTAAGMRDHDSLSVYSVFYSLIHPVPLGPRSTTSSEGGLSSASWPNPLFPARLPNDPSQSTC